jgi:hypothetical protein
MDEGLLKLWTLCMSKANWESNSVKMDGITQPVKLKPGQFVTGRYELHGEYHQWRRGYKKRFPSARTLWRWLKTLERMEFLTIKTTNRFSIISMGNWPTEQTNKQKVSSNVTNSCPTAVHREELNKHYKEGKERSDLQDKANIRPCKSCGQGFIPSKPWHEVCDDCYRSQKQSAYNFRKCKGCGAEDSTVDRDTMLCNFCRFKQEQAI